MRSGEDLGPPMLRSPLHITAGRSRGGGT